MDQAVLATPYFLGQPAEHRQVPQVSPSAAKNTHFWRGQEFSRDVAIFTSTSGRREEQGRFYGAESFCAHSR